MLPPFSTLCSLEALESFTCVCSPLLFFYRLQFLASGLASPSSSLYCHHPTVRLILILILYRNFYFSAKWLCLIHNLPYISSGSVTSTLVLPFYPKEPFSAHCLLLFLPLFSFWVGSFLEVHVPLPN